MVDLNEKILKIKEIILSYLYSKEESENKFKEYYKNNILYFNGELNVNKDLNNFRNEIKLSELTLENTYNKNLILSYDDGLILKGDNYYFEKILPIKSKGIEFIAHININSFLDKTYMGIQYNSQPPMIFNFGFEDNTVEFLINNDSVSSLDLSDEVEEYYIYFKIRRSDNKFRYGYRLIGIKNNRSEILLEDGLLTNKQIESSIVKGALYSLINNNVEDNSILKINSLNINPICKWSDGVRLPKEVQLNVNKLKFTELEEITLNATVIDVKDNYLTDTLVKFYSGTQLLGTAKTNEQGEAILVLPKLAQGIYDICCVCEYMYSNHLNIIVSNYLDNYMELSVNSNQFNPVYNGDMFEFNGDMVIVEWGDGALSIYDGGKLYHKYEMVGVYTVKIYGDIVSLLSNMGFNGLKSVSFPDSMRSLGDNSFSNCNSLISVKLNNGLEVIGRDCFNACNNLKSIRLPDSINSIGDNAFKNSDLLKNIKFNWDTDDGILIYNNLWFSIEMLENLNINIPQDTMELYVSKDYPIENLIESSLLSLDINYSVVYAGEQYELTGRLDLEDVDGEEVLLFENDELIDTLTVNENGEFSKSLIASNGGEYNYYVKYEKDTINIISLVVELQVIEYNFVISSDVESVIKGHSFNILGNFSLSGESINLYENDELISTIITGENGEFNVNLVRDVINNYSYYMEYTDGIRIVVSDTVTVRVTDKLTPQFSISVSPTTVLIGRQYTVSGRLIGPTGSNYLRVIKDGGLMPQPIMTNANGEFSMSYAESTVGVYKYAVVYANYQDTVYKTGSSSEVSVRVKKDNNPKTLTVSASPPNPKVNDVFVLTAKLVDSEGDACSNVKLDLNLKGLNGADSWWIGAVTTNSNGEAQMWQLSVNDPQTLIFQARVYNAPSIIGSLTLNITN